MCVQRSLAALPPLAHGPNRCVRGTVSRGNAPFPQGRCVTAQPDNLTRYEFVEKIASGDIWEFFLSSNLFRTLLFAYDGE
jgi:hypothetical protein